MRLRQWRHVAAWSCNLTCGLHTSSNLKVGVSGTTVKQLSPAVLALVRRNNLDVSVIAPTGPKGHILKGDVLAFLARDIIAKHPVKNDAAARVGGQSSSVRNYVDFPVSNIRKIIASRLTDSKTTIPHAYAQADVDMTRLANFRKAMIEDHGIKFSYNDAIIKAAGLTLRVVPGINSRFDKGGVVGLPTVDISIAVATPNGLITPIITSADSRGLLDISNTVKELAHRAKNGKLQPHEYQGGSFSISNLGMMGIKKFSAVINPPQGCILAVGETRPEVRSCTDKGFEIHSMATFTLSADARVCDDELSAKWLMTFKGYLEHPQLMLK